MDHEAADVNGMDGPPDPVSPSPEPGRAGAPAADPNAAPPGGPPAKKLGRRRVVLWAALVAFTVAFGIAFHCVERDRRKREDEDDAFTKRQQEVGYAVWHDSEKLLRNGGHPLPREQVGEGESIARVPATVLDPSFEGWFVELRFFDAYAHAPPLVTVIPPPHVAYEGPSQTWVWMERARSGLFWAASGVWYLGVFFCPFIRPARRKIAEVCLGALLVMAVTWFLRPEYDFTPRLNTIVSIALVAGLGFTLLLLFVPLAPPPGARLCRGCGFNLAGCTSETCPKCGRVRRSFINKRLEDQSYNVQSEEPAPAEEGGDAWLASTEETSTEDATTEQASDEFAVDAATDADKIALESAQPGQEPGETTEPIAPHPAAGEVARKTPAVRPAET